MEVWYSASINKIGLALSGSKLIYYPSVVFIASRVKGYVNSRPITAYSSTKGWTKLGKY